MRSAKKRKISRHARCLLRVCAVRAECPSHVTCPGIPLTWVLQTGVFGIVEMCLALMRKLVFRGHEARVFACRSNICQVTRRYLFPKPLLSELQMSELEAGRPTPPPPARTSFSICACHSLRRGHANLLCIAPCLADDPRRES